MKKIIIGILTALIVAFSVGLFLTYRGEGQARQAAFEAALDTANYHRTRVLLDQKRQIKTALIEANFREPNEAVDMANAELSRIDSELAQLKTR